MIGLVAKLSDLMTSSMPQRGKEAVVASGAEADRQGPEADDPLAAQGSATAVDSSGIEQAIALSRLNHIDVLRPHVTSWTSRGLSDDMHERDKWTQVATIKTEIAERLQKDKADPATNRIIELCGAELRTFSGWMLTFEFLTLGQKLEIIRDWASEQLHWAAIAGHGQCREPDCPCKGSEATSL